MKYLFDIFYYTEHELVHELSKEIIAKRSEEIIKKIEMFKGLFSSLKNQDSDKIVTLTEKAIDLVRNLALNLISRRKSAKYWRKSERVDESDEFQNLLGFIRAAYTDNFTTLPDTLPSCNECKLVTCSSSNISEYSIVSRSRPTTKVPLVATQYHSDNTTFENKTLKILTHKKRQLYFGSRGAAYSQQIVEANELFNHGVMILSDRSLEKIYRLNGKLKFPQIYDHNCDRVGEKTKFFYTIIRGRLRVETTRSDDSTQTVKETGSSKENDIPYDDTSLCNDIIQLLQPGQSLVVCNHFQDDCLKDDMLLLNDDTSIETPNVSPIRSSEWTSQYQFLFDDLYHADQMNAETDGRSQNEHGTSSCVKWSVKHVDLYYSSDDEDGESDQEHQDYETNKTCFISEDGTKHTDNF